MFPLEGIMVEDYEINMSGLDVFLYNEDNKKLKLTSTLEMKVDV